MKKFSINMIGGKERVFNQFAQQVVAVDYAEVLFLKRFLLENYHDKLYLNCTQILDFQQYRLIKKRAKVNEVLKRSESERVFVFPVNIN